MSLVYQAMRGQRKSLLEIQWQGAVTTHIHKQMQANANECKRMQTNMQTNMQAYTSHRLLHSYLREAAVRLGAFHVYEVELRHAHVGVHVEKLVEFAHLRSMVER